MAMIVSLSEAAQARADELIRSGQCTSFSELVHTALGNGGPEHDPETWIDEPVDLDTLSPEDRAAVEEGLADIEAGRTIPAEEVFDRLHEKYRAMALQR